MRKIQEGKRSFFEEASLQTTYENYLLDIYAKQAKMMINKLAFTE